ncbi:unnamed protein product [Effrenium voratum]|uniref:Ubiquitin-like domain-containing protein n=1 Tax=Effrenium voratum TaxID=2562239 RepID=A0AA36HR18_9DINO|nr:unnamed protein product [Effrenium voratum]
MALFFLQNSEEVKAFQVRSGQVVADVSQLEVELPSAEALAKLPRKSLTDILYNLNIRMTNVAKANREKLAEEMVKQFSKIKSAAKKATPTQPSSSSNEAPVESDLDVPTSGNNNELLGDDGQQSVSVLDEWHGASGDEMPESLPEEDEEDIEATTVDEPSCPASVWTEDKEASLALLELLNSRPGINVNSHELMELRREKARAMKPTNDENEDYERMVSTLKSEGLWDKTIIVRYTITAENGVTKTKRVPVAWTSTTSVDDLYNEVAKYMGVETNAIRLFHGGKHMSELYRRVAEYAIEEDKEVVVGVNLKGGGVQRTIVKKKQRAVVSKEGFEKSLEIATRVDAMTSASFGTHLDNLSTKDLEEIGDDFAHGKGNIQVKLRNLINYSAEYQQILSTMECLEDTKSKMLDSMLEAIATECADAKGNFKVVNLKHMISVALGIRMKMTTQSRQNASHNMALG